MKKIILIMVLAIGLFANAEIKKEAQDCVNILKTNDKELIARSGCCSHHGGVCGCSNSRVTCCDGSKSPSCTCKSENKLNDIKVIR